MPKVPAILRRAKLVLCALALGVVGGFSPAVAHAGYGVQPASGTTTSPEPTFLVYLDQYDSLASVHVSTSTEMTSTGWPVVDIGSCSPTTPFGEVNKYTCAPATYSSTGTSKLAPGTYYWWVTFRRSDPAEASSGTRVSGPFQFTVAASTAVSAALVSPADRSTPAQPIQLSVRAPAGSTLRIHASRDGQMTADGTPYSLDFAGCKRTVTADGVYTCALNGSTAVKGETYYWWAVIESGEGSRILGPWTLTIGAAPSSGTGGVAPTRTRAAAPNLPTVQRWRGASAKQGRLSAAVYQYSKWLGYPRRVAVACWSDRDWPSVTESAKHHNLLGFWSPEQPRWLHLAPQTCRAMETLLTSRPQYPNVITANALDTVAHEMIHAMGIRNEAVTECFAMQTADVLGWYLGIRGQYLKGLSRLFLAAYKYLPDRYRNPVRCREGGAWDLEPKNPSAPWHP